MSLYAQYIKEREGKHILENEHGYATYMISGQECYIEDIYVVPEMRKSGVGAALADAITVEAKERGCKWLLGSVIPVANGSTTSLKVLLAYGFRLLKSEQNLIVMVKEI